jgi:hypothetical protein
VISGKLNSEGTIKVVYNVASTEPVLMEILQLGKSLQLR